MLPIRQPVLFGLHSAESILCEQLIHVHLTDNMGSSVKFCFLVLWTEALKAIIAQNELRGKIVNPSCYKLRLKKIRIKRLNGCHSS
jgi:hypothetical protein